jgi:hypothetical protein
LDESVVREFEQQQVGTLKLSAAIRIGAAATRPTTELRAYRRRSWIDIDDDGVCHACVIAAAWIGTGAAYGNHEYVGTIGTSWLMQRFGVSRAVAVAVHLDYEDEEKTREQIADWLDGMGL